jgi:hypothetical protein
MLYQEQSGNPAAADGKEGKKMKRGSFFPAEEEERSRESTDVEIG